MRRSLTILAIVLAGVHAGCGGDSTRLVARSPTVPASPSVPGLSGILTVTTTLTATGGYQYTVVIQLTETAGVSGVIQTVSVGHVDVRTPVGGLPIPPIATFGPEAWNGSNIILAQGRLTSKPLVSTEESIFWDAPIGATVTFSDPTSTVTREIDLMDSSQRWPEPPPDSRFTLSGTVVDGSNHALSDVTVEVVDGSNAGRATTTDGEGSFRLADLGPGTFPVRFSKPDYVSTLTSVKLNSNRSMRHILQRQ